MCKPRKPLEIRTSPAFEIKDFKRVPENLDMQAYSSLLGQNIRTVILYQNYRSYLAKEANNNKTEVIVKFRTPYSD